VETKVEVGVKLDVKTGVESGFEVKVGGNPEVEVTIDPEKVAEAEVDVGVADVITPVSRLEVAGTAERTRDTSEEAAICDCDDDTNEV